MSPWIRIAGPALASSLLVLGAIIRLWGDDAGSEAAAVMLGAGLVLLGISTWEVLRNKSTDGDDQAGKNDRDMV